MSKETEQYLTELQRKINETDKIFVENSDDFNRGYLAGRKLTINDVVNAIRKLEG